MNPISFFLPLHMYLLCPKYGIVINEMKFMLLLHLHRLLILSYVLLGQALQRSLKFQDKTETMLKLLPSINIFRFMTCKTKTAVQQRRMRLHVRTLIGERKKTTSGRCPRLYKSRPKPTTRITRSHHLQARKIRSLHKKTSGSKA